MTKGDPCRICDSVDDSTDEDIESLWVRKAENDMLPDPTQARPKEMTWFCDPCNNELANEFEFHAAPLLRKVIAQGTATWTISEQRKVARWVCYKDIAYALARDEYEDTAGNVQPVTPEMRAEWRRRLAELRQIRGLPNNWFCRMIVSGHPEDPRMTIDPKPYFPKQLDPSEIVVASFTPAGLALFESFAAPLAWVKTFSDLTQHDARTHRLWPSHARDVTVPKVIVPVKDHARLMTEWNHRPSLTWGAERGPQRFELDWPPKHKNKL